MYLYTKPTIAITQIKGADSEMITRENVPALIGRYGLDFASRLIDSLLQEREENEKIVRFPVSDVTLCENLKRYIEEEQGASYETGFDDGVSDGYESGYEDGEENARRELGE